MKNTNKRHLLAAVLLGALAGFWGAASAAQTPTGPYSKTCTKCSVNGKLDTLFCTCNNAEGKPQNASLSLRNCTAPINNCNGALHCGACP